VCTLLLQEKDRDRERKRERERGRNPRDETPTSDLPRKSTRNARKRAIALAAATISGKSPEMERIIRATRACVREEDGEGDEGEGGGREERITGG